MSGVDLEPPPADAGDATAREPAAIGATPTVGGAIEGAAEPDDALVDPYVDPAPAQPVAAPPRRSFRDFGHVYVLVGLLLAALAVRLATLPMIEMGGDAVKAWFNAKQLTLGITDRYWAWDHHSIRFAIIVPTWIVQEIFGLRPQVYYIVPLAWGLAQVGLLYAIGRRLGRPGAGFCAALAVVFFPYMERNAAQLLGEVPSGLTAILGVYVLLLYRDNPARRRTYAVLLAFVLFHGWLIKLTNVLFVPAFALCLWLVARRVRDVALFLGVLFALFLGETLLYRALTKHSLGQLSVVSGSHLRDKRLKATAFRKFFTHVVDLVPVWKITLVSFAVATSVAFARWRRWGRDVSLVALVPLSFLLLQNFAVKSLDPLVPVQRFLPRYLLPAMPLMAYVVFHVLSVLGEAGADKVSPARFRPSNRVRGAVAGAVLVGITIWALAVRLGPAKTHPLTLLSRYGKEGNALFAQGAPVVGIDTPKDPDFFLKVLWTGLRSEKKLAKMPRLTRVKMGRSKAYYAFDPRKRKEPRGKAKQEVFDSWRGKEVVLAKHRKVPGVAMGNAFELEIAKLP